MSLRQGNKIPINIYDGDRPVCQCQTVADAKRIAEADRRIEALESALKGIAVCGTCTACQVAATQALHYAALAQATTPSGPTDTERLNWLDANVGRCGNSPGQIAAGSPPGYLHFRLDAHEVETAESRPGFAGHPKTTIREAIDAAMRESKESKEAKP